MTLLMQVAAEQPETKRGRWWFGQLFKHAPKRGYRQADAVALIVANWDRTGKSFKTDGVIDPEA